MFAHNWEVLLNMHDTSYCWKPDTMEVGNSSKKYFFINVDSVTGNHIINFIVFLANLNEGFNRILIDASEFTLQQIRDILSLLWIKCWCAIIYAVTKCFIEG